NPMLSIRLIRLGLGAWRRRIGYLEIARRSETTKAGDCTTSLHSKTSRPEPAKGSGRILCESRRTAPRRSRLSVLRAASFPRLHPLRELGEQLLVKGEVFAQQLKQLLGCLLVFNDDAEHLAIDVQHVLLFFILDVECLRNRLTLFTRQAQRQAHNNLRLVGKVQLQRSVLLVSGLGEISKLHEGLTPNRAWVLNVWDTPAPAKTQQTGAGVGCGPLGPHIRNRWSGS